MLRKEVNNSPIPWLSFIAAGFKTYEGRLANKIAEWSLHVGKRMVFYCEDLEVSVVITKLRVYNSFGHAFNQLGSKLVPIHNITTPQVEGLYRQYFSDVDVLEQGVVAIKVDVISIRQI
jgi:ASC-1-like (ASCH) protein